MMLNILKSVLVFVVILFIIGLQLRKSKILRFLFRGTLRNIVADDKLLGIADNTISEIVTAFETFFNRKFRIYKPEFTTQLNLFTD